MRVAALNPKDVMLRKGRFRVLSGARFPKSVGLEFAGEIVDLEINRMTMSDSGREDLVVIIPERSRRIVLPERRPPSFSNQASCAGTPSIAGARHIPLWKGRNSQALTYTQNCRP